MPSSWAAFMAWTESHGSGAFLFRGQGDQSAIIPKIGRSEYGYSRSREKSLFNAFKDRARPFLQVSVRSGFEWLALAQHHGTPSRLVDWTTSPLVAAWFAVTSYPLATDAVVLALETSRRGLFTLDAGNGLVSNGSTLAGPLEPTGGVYLMETSPVSSRITTQRGLFTLHGNPRAVLPIPRQHYFVIPVSERIFFQSRLLDLGIEASHIFPDLDGLCKSLDWRMRTGKGFSAFA